MRNKQKPDNLNQMALEDGASKVAKDLLLVQPGEDNEALDTKHKPN